MPYEFIYLRRSFITGTMRAEAAYTRMTFLALLFENTHGVFTGTAEYLASVSGLTLEAVQRGMERLSTPDPESTSPAEDGRRIVPVEGRRNTWRIVNWNTYQPALTSIEDDPLRPPRRLPDGSDNPAYFTWIKRKQREAKKGAEALDKAMVEMSTVGGKPGPKVPDEPANGGQNGGLDQVQNRQNVHHVHPKENKEKENKEVKEPLSPLSEESTGDKKPKQRKTPVPSRKAIDSKGNPRWNEWWEKFDKAYPRRGNGKSLNRADARLIFDALMDSGEDPAPIVAGVERYAKFKRDTNDDIYIRMMSTWLNKRSWEEEWSVNPASELGKEMAKKRAKEADENRKRYHEENLPAFNAWIQDQAAGDMARPEFVADFESHIREKMATSTPTGAKMWERSLTVPEKRQHAIFEYWQSVHEAALPGFWDWARDHNGYGGRR